ncbi:MAG: hypothetical protein ACE5HV_04210 [Acidobacteriota bacterium]
MSGKGAKRGSGAELMERIYPPSFYRCLCGPVWRQGVCRRLHWAAGWLLLTSLFLMAACVSRNVEEIGSEEAAAIPSPPPPRPVSSAAATQAAPTANRISGVVEVSAELADRVPAGAVLFLIVRVAGRQGGPPLAVQQHRRASFPLRFVISEQDAMVPGTRLVGQMTITAKVDQDGDALTSTAGDLSGRAGPVDVGASDVTVTLDEVLTGADR